MQQTILINEQNQLVPTHSYPHLKFPFENFNPVQSRVLEFYNKNNNIIVAAATSSGKTVCALLTACHCLQEGKIIYLAPLKALAQEKYDEWTDTFPDKKISICTGDYRVTEARRRELAEADIIIKTFEMLNSKCRNYKAEKNEYLQNVKLLICDESHSLTFPKRGDHLEAALMKFSEVNPSCRMMFLSASMPNVKEIGEWLTNLTKRETIVIQSEYRPCPLFVHYRNYYDRFSYDQSELAKVNTAIEIIEEFPKDKFVCFVHTKRTGELLTKTLKEQGIECEFHNADLDKDKRVKIERRFKEDPNFRIIVSTSTLAIGLNMPARRVIILGVHRGLTEVETYDIHQQCGRAGRPQYDPRGDAYILLPMNKASEHIRRLKEPQSIKSQMVEEKTLAFHLNSEIHHKNIKNNSDIGEWYTKTLAYHQKNRLDKSFANEVVTKLKRCGAITDKTGEFEPTSIGVISSMFYFSPFDVSDLQKNFTEFFEEKGGDEWLCLSLANIDSYKFSIANGAEKDEVGKFKKELEKISDKSSIHERITDGIAKIAFCYYNLINGKQSLVLNAPMRGLQTDFERTHEVLNAIDSMSAKWNKQDFFKQLSMRMKYGVTDDLIDLCKIKGIGKVKATKLYNSGIKSPKDIKDVISIMKVLKCSKKVAEEVLEDAKNL